MRRATAEVHREGSTRRTTACSRGSAALHLGACSTKSGKLETEAVSAALCLLSRRGESRPPEAKQIDNQMTAPPCPRGQRTPSETDTSRKSDAAFPPPQAAETPSEAATIRRADGANTCPTGQRPAPCQRRTAAPAARRATPSFVRSVQIAGHNAPLFVNSFTNHSHSPRFHQFPAKTALFTGRILDKTNVFSYNLLCWVMGIRPDPLPSASI